MGLKVKDVVTEFYKSNFHKGEQVLSEILHPEVELAWYGTTGFRKLDFQGIVAISNELSSTYESLRAEVEKVIDKKDEVAIHFTYHVRTIENPDEEMPLAHFIAIWEIKDDKLYKGVQISQLGEEIEDSPWAAS